MTAPVSVPLWLFILIIAFALTSFASNFLFPSVRWFFRARMERALKRLNQRLDRPIDIFKLAERQDRIARLVYDARVMEAVSDHARDTGVPGPVAFEEARRYAREIVPGFSTTLYFGVAIRLARWLSRSLYRVRFGQISPVLRADRSAGDGDLRDEPPQQHGLRAGDLAGIGPCLDLLCGGRMGAGLADVGADPGDGGLFHPARSSRNAFYRRVLARYVQMATEEGITQAIFPEGGLSLDGRVGEAKLGLLSYIMAGERRARCGVRAGRAGL